MGYNLLFNLSNKTALITGAAGLLGTEFAKGLAAHKCNLILIDSDEYKLNEVSAMILNEFDIICKTFVCDIVDEQSVANLAKFATDCSSTISQTNVLQIISNSLRIIAETSFNLYSSESINIKLHLCAARPLANSVPNNPAAPVISAVLLDRLKSRLYPILVIFSKDRFYHTTF